MASKLASTSTAKPDAVGSTANGTRCYNQDLFHKQPAVSISVRRGQNETLTLTDVPEKLPQPRQKTMLLLSMFQVKTR